MAERATTHTSITGFGVWHPETSLDNTELCIAFNEFVRRDNAKHADAIAAGTREALKESSPEFIVKASGIERRYVHDKTGLVDPERMCPNIRDRPADEVSVQAEYAVNAARKGKTRPSMGKRTARTPSPPIRSPTTPATRISRRPPPRKRDAALELNPKASTVTNGP